MTRNEALKKLVHPPYTEEIEDDFEYVANKLEIIDTLKILYQKNKTFRDYKSNYKLINFLSIIKISKIKRIIQ